MTVNRKPTGRASAIPAGLAFGGAVSGAITILGALLTAKLMDAQVLQWHQSGYAVLLILLISAWAGAVMAAGKIKRQRFVVCLGAGCVYFLMLMITTALFFGGQYSGVGETGLLILCGCVLGIFTGFQGKSRRKHRKTRIRNC